MIFQLLISLQSENMAASHDKAEKVYLVRVCEGLVNIEDLGSAERSPQKRSGVQPSAQAVSLVSLQQRPTNCKEYSVYSQELE